MSYTAVDDKLNEDGIKHIHTITSPGIQGKTIHYITSVRVLMQHRLVKQQVFIPIFSKEICRFIDPGTLIRYPRLLCLLFDNFLLFLDLF